MRSHLTVFIQNFLYHNINLNCTIQHTFIILGGLFQQLLSNKLGGHYWSLAICLCSSVQFLKGLKNVKC